MEDQGLPRDFASAVAIRLVEHNEYESIHPAEINMPDNSQSLPYGGMILAFSIEAGYASVTATYHLYSLVGNFLSAGRAGHRLRAKIRHVRDTPSFATRHLDIFQTIPGQEMKHIATMILAFQVAQTATLMSYSASPSSSVGIAEAWSETDMEAHASRRGIEPARRRWASSGLKPRRRYFETRSPLDGFGAETWLGLFPALDLHQRQRSVTDKRVREFWRVRHALGASAVENHLAALAFILDAGMALVPPAFGALHPSRVAAAVSLDFAVRIFVNDVDATEWLLREEKTLTGGFGRTFNEATLWDRNGRMVASMSQQCLLKPAKSKL